MSNRYIFDDVVSAEPPNTRQSGEMVKFLQSLGVLAGVTRGGSYRNAAGELVTWEATADGSYVSIRTWPGE